MSSQQLSNNTSMFSLPEYLQGQKQLRNSGDSDVSDTSYQTTDSLPGTRQSSINTEPLTLDADQISDAKVEAIDVLEHTDPESAFDVFTKDLQVKHEKALSAEAQAKVLQGQFESLVQKAAKIVAANEKQAQTTSKIPGASKENVEEGDHHVESKYL